MGRAWNFHPSLAKPESASGASGSISQVHGMPVSEVLEALIHVVQALRCDHLRCDHGELDGLGDHHGPDVGHCMSL